ncbi:hypothetical protein TCAL_14176 [Tigriopus californicus]|uniref:Uncharacterized protein n=1 Tax=Tigriopus californicus TaxID=6832 RepID=A0A553PPM8_TIGCA|nr:hypothetical protein TCAL_14176 [Tigriopus californicus]|eukprot:TCALIF_14176-PA protein Name:"Protein of unknown function" AED:0.04 eAED:0.06 QI:0/-1/0/1/-1/1/1/0/140
MTPRPDGYSPAFGFFGRHLRIGMPDVHAAGFDAHKMEDFVRARRLANDASMAGAGGRELAHLEIGTSVHVQDPIGRSWTACGGAIVGQCDSGRSYIVSTPTGTVRRNRRFLRPAPPSGGAIAKPIASGCAPGNGPSQMKP